MSQPASEDIRFGRYTIRKPLGTGGMATVYAATFGGPGGAVRPVALKLIHAHLSRQENFISMFLAETAVAMSLTHRNIVQTFDAGIESGRHFLAMELIDGCSLRELITRAGPRGLPLDVCLFIGMEICAGLHHAHTFRPELTGQVGAVVHRDISPSNILLSSAGDVKLADFGVAKALTRLNDHSISAMVKGKVMYMAPEQGMGKAQPASDLFSLGAVLYEIIASRPIRLGDSIAEVLRLPDDLPTLTEVRPEVTPALDTIIAKSLALRAEDRFADAAAMREALSQEYFALQVRSGHTDGHARLRTVLDAFPKPQPNKQAAAIADALLAQARHLETAPDAGRPISGANPSIRPGSAVRARQVATAQVPPAASASRLPPPIASIATTPDPSCAITAAAAASMTIPEQPTVMAGRPQADDPLMTTGPHQPAHVFATNASHVTAGQLTGPELPA